MRPTESFSMLELWLDACAGEADWTGPLTWSQDATGARAIALVSRDFNGAPHLRGASIGAPADFLNLCRDLGSGPCAPGVQERYVAGTGRLAWAAVTPAMSAILFALYDNDADLDILRQVARVAGKCLATRSDGEARKTVSSLKSVALAQLPVGVAILDDSGACIEANVAADAVFSRADGLFLRGNRLACRDARDLKALNAALKDVKNDAPDLFVPIARDGAATPYVLRVLRQGASDTACIVMIVDPDVPPAVAPEVWRAMFNLTECELLVAQALVSGGNVTDLARRRGVTVGTVRQQKKSMLARLEVTSQAAAAAVLSRVAPFAPAWANGR